MMGGEIPYFVGKQYGTGWLRSLGRIAFPILKKLVGVATNTAEDVLMNEKPFLSSLSSNAVGAAKDYFQGRGVKRPGTIRSINKAKKMKISTKFK